MTEYRKFELSTKGLLRMLGRHLVTDPVIPVFEMVKNSWDACARNVTVDIFSDRIAVSDDGAGFPGEKMKRWFSVGDMGGSDYESHCPWRGETRIRTGQFDIGHIVPFVLGNKLTLLTCDSDHRCTKVSVDFRTLETSEAPIEAENLEDPAREAGTAMVVSELNPAVLIDDNFITRVRRTLQTFRNRGEYFSIKVKDHTRDGPPESSTYDSKFDGPKGKGLAEKTNFSLKIQGNDLKFMVAGKDMSGDGRLTELMRKEIENTRKTKNQSISFDGIPSLLADVKITGRTYSRDLPEWEYGVFIYRNGVRVMPYGSVYGSDWLGLDKERAERGGSPFPRNKNIFCTIDISRKQNPELTDTMDREGLFENKAFYLLYSMTRSLLVRVNELPGESHPPRNPRGTPRPRYTAEEELSMLRWLISRMRMSKSMKTKVISAIDRAIQEVRDGGHIINAYSTLIDFFNESILKIRQAARGDPSISNASENDVINLIARGHAYKNTISDRLNPGANRDFDCLLKDILRASHDLGNISRHVSNNDFSGEQPEFSFLDRPDGFMTAVLVMASVVQLLTEGELVDSSIAGFRCGDVPSR